MNVALIGYGYFGPNIFKNLEKFDFIKTVTVCDTCEPSLSKVESAVKKVKKTQDINEILNNKEIEIVFIATPIHTHFDIVKLCLTHKKHVFVEKPAALSLNEVFELSSLSERQNVFINVDHTFIYTPEVNLFKDIIKFDILGKIRYYSSQRVNLGPFLTKAGVIDDLACHDISILNYLFNNEKLESVSAIGISPRYENVWDDARIIINYKASFRAFIHVSWLCPTKRRETVIAGSKSIIHYDSAEPQRPPVLTDIETKKTKEITHITNLGEPLEVEINHFFERLKQNKHTLSNIYRETYVVNILDKIKESLASQGETIYF